MVMDMKKLSFDFDRFSSGLLAGFVMFTLLAAAFGIIAVAQVIVSLAPASVKTGVILASFLVVLGATAIFGVIIGFGGPAKKLPLDARGSFVVAEALDGTKGLLNVKTVMTINRIYRDGILQNGKYHLRFDGDIVTRVHIDKNPWLKELIDAAGMTEWD